MPSTVELENIIALSLDRLVRSNELQDWLSGLAISQGDFLIINNSVLIRTVSKTVKSTKYLGLKVITPSPLEYEVKVLNFPRKIKDFTHISVRNKEIELLEEIDLSEAIREELTILGRLIFILIGIIDTNEIFDQIIGHSLFDRIVFELIFRCSFKNSRKGNRN